MSSMPKILYGHDLTENIVAIEPMEGRSMVEVFYRQFGMIQSEYIPYKHFLFMAESNPMLSRLAGMELMKLRGGNYYNVLVESPDIGQVFRTINDIEDRVAVWNQTEAFMIRSGKTLFKGMGFNDPVVLAVDIETLSAGGFSNAERSTDQVIIIAMLDNRGNEYTLHQSSDMDEAALLREFVVAIRKIDPDIIIGHNIFGFDLPYLRKRCEQLGVSFALGRNGAQPTYKTKTKKFADKMREYEEYHVYGRHIVDTELLARQVDAIKRQYDSYGLKYLAKQLGAADESRQYVEGDQITKTWHEDPNKLLAYATDDVKETQALYTAFGGALFASTQFVPMSMQQVFQRGTGGQIEAMFMRYYLAHGHSWPKPEAKREYSGGYADVLTHGLVEGPLVYADVDSLYPSLAQVLNIQPKRDEIGYFQQLLRVLKDKRFELKANIKSDPARKEQHKATDGAIKVYLNTMSYGFIGWEHGAFNDYDEAERITTNGRNILKSMIELTQLFGAQATKADSVTEDTPIYLRKDGLIEIVSIATLHHMIGKAGSDPLRNYKGFEQYETLTRGGWRKINYTKCHQIDKPILRVTTRNGLAKVTEDHSLFSDGVEVKPKDLRKGDTIDELPYQDFGQSTNVDPDVAWLIGLMVGDGSASLVRRKTRGYSTNVSLAHSNPDNIFRAVLIFKSKFNMNMKLYNTMKSSGTMKVTGGYNQKDYDLWFNLLYDPYTKEKYIHKSILNAQPEAIESFIDGYFAADGYQYKEKYVYTTKSYILTAGLQYLMHKTKRHPKLRIDVRSDKQNMIVLVGMDNAARRERIKDGVVRKVEPYEYTNAVYDISTEDGTFVGGTGQVIFHNTDGMLCTIPTGFTPDSWCIFLSDQMQDGINISNDGEYQRAILFDKKSYVLVGMDGKVTMKGNTLKGRSIEKFGQQFIAECTDALLEGRKEDIVSIYKHYEAKITEGRLTAEDISVRKDLKVSLREYKKKLLGEKNYNPQPQYEVALAEPEEYHIGDSVHMYVAAPPLETVMVRGKQVTRPARLAAYEKAKHINHFAGDYDHEHYLKRLHTHLKRFLLLYTPEEFTSTFGVKLYAADRRKYQNA